MERISLDFPEGRAAFAARFSARTPNPITDDFLTQCRCVGFAEKGELVGGYLVNCSPPYRYIRKIPADQRGETVDLYLAENQCVELACMWINWARISRGQRALVYLNALYDALTAGRRWIVCGTVKEKIGLTHKLIFRREVYKGPTTFPGHPDGEIYAASRWEVLRRIPSALIRDRRRRRIKQSLAPRADTSTS